MMAPFIVIDGIDGSGKGVQLERLWQALQTQGHVAIHARDPGGTPFSFQLRHALLSSTPRSPMAETLGFCAARADVVDNVIRPARLAGKIVLMDRFTASTVAYQGALGVPFDTVMAMSAEAVGDCTPTATILLDLSVEEAAKRIAATGRVLDGVESRPPKYHERVRGNFLLFSELREAGLVAVIDADRDPDAVFADVWKIVAPLLPPLL